MERSAAWCPPWLDLLERIYTWRQGRQLPAHHQQDVEGKLWPDVVNVLERREMDRETMFGYHTLTLHVVWLERVAHVQRGRAQQDVCLQGLVAPHPEHQLAERSHNPEETNNSEHGDIWMEGSDVRKPCRVVSFISVSSIHQEADPVFSGLTPLTSNVVNSLTRETKQHYSK